MGTGFKLPNQKKSSSPERFKSLEIWVVQHRSHQRANTAIDHAQDLRLASVRRARNVLRSDALGEFADFIGLAAVAILYDARFRLLDHFFKQVARSKPRGAGCSRWRSIGLLRLRRRSGRAQPQLARGLLE